jgi:hypothetical protein
MDSVNINLSKCVSKYHDDVSKITQDKTYNENGSKQHDEMIKAENNYNNCISGIETKKGGKSRRTRGKKSRKSRKNKSRRFRKKSSKLFMW